MKLLSLVVAVVVLVSAPAFAQSVEERLSKLEQEVRALRAENEELRKQIGVAPAPVEAPGPPQEVKPADNGPSLRVGGFIQAQADAGDRVDTRFGDDHDRVYLRRARVNVQGSFAEEFDFKAEVDIAGGLGSASGVRAQGTDLYVQWSQYPLAHIRAGQFKAPFGYELLHSSTKIMTVERTLGMDRIALSRQIGVQLAGDAGRVAYAVGAFNGNGTNASFNEDEDFLLAGRLSGTLFERGETTRWTAGVNGYRSEDGDAAVAPELAFANNAFAGTRRAFGADTQLLAGRLELWGEILRARFEPADGTATRELNSWYVLGGWSLTKKVQAVARVDSLDGPAADVRTWTAGVNYFIKGHDIKLQLNLMRTDDKETRVLARLQTLF